MTQKEVADLIGVSPMTLSRWLRSGKFPECCRVINGYRQPGTFDRATVEAWIKENVKDAN